MAGMLTDSHDTCKHSELTSGGGFASYTSVAEEVRGTLARVCGRVTHGILNTGQDATVTKRLTW